MRNLSYEDKFDLHEYEPVGKTHFHMKGFALRLVLTHIQKGTRKWPIENCSITIAEIAQLLFIREVVVFVVFP